jgi:hypothetical protein
MMPTSRLFFKALFKHWWGLMSCAAFTFAAIFAGFAHKTADWVVGVSCGLGLVFFLIAAYLAWRDEYLRASTSEKALEGLKRTIEHERAMPHILLEYATIGKQYKYVVAGLQDINPDLVTEFTVVNCSDVDAFQLYLDPEVRIGDLDMVLYGPIKRIPRNDRRPMPYLLIYRKTQTVNLEAKANLTELMDRLAAKSEDGIFSTQVRIAYVDFHGRQFSKTFNLRHNPGVLGSPFIEIPPA